MALNWKGVAGNYDDTLYAFMKQLEAPLQSQRLNVLQVNGNPTIGIGFDLYAGGRPVQLGVLKGMGLKVDVLKVDADSRTPAQKKEFDYINDLFVAAKAKKSQADFDAIMLRRKNDTDAAFALLVPDAQRRDTFTFSPANNESEVRATFDDLWQNKYREDIYNKWPELRGDTRFA
ncbi:MAG TPA: hypothetical protein PKD38_20165, partial [Nitrospira sp.]|nr:hypothetical protein [Nitrospira sp.]